MSTSSRDRSRRALVLGTGAGLIGAAVAPAASAATFEVTTLDDAGAGSLRQAIADANGAAGADVVTFQAGLTGTITLTTGQLAITDSVDIQGPGAAALSVSGNNASRVFYLYNSSANLAVTISGLTITGGNANIGGGIVNFDEDLTLDGVTISGNSASGDGGGLWADGFNMDLVVRNSTISGNTAGSDGGGVYIEDTGAPLLFENTVIANNNAGDDGGGIYLYDPDHSVTFDRCTISGNTAGHLGGGIYLYSHDNGVHTLRDTTVSGNSAQAGGGLFLYSPDHGLELENVTVSGNTATAGNGGGVYLYNLYGNSSARHSTIAGNSATGSGGGLHVQSSELVVNGFLVADNTAGTNADLSTGAGGSVAASFSLFETPGTASITDNGGLVLNQDPQLGPLQDNGGPTFTQAPAPASPAVDAGDPAFAPPPANDQRGLPRTQGGTIDIGAVELQVSTVTLDAASYSVDEDGATLTVTVTRDQPIGTAAVDIATSDASAAAGADYTAVAQTVAFADGTLSVTVDIPILDDALAEGDETFDIALSNPGVLTVLGATTSATATIVDVEGGTFDFDSATYTVAEDGGSLLVTVTRSAGSTTAATVDYATADGSADSGDYTATAGTLAFAAGDTSATFSVPILDDAAAEGAETFTLTLSNPTGGATLGATASATATIDDVEGGSFEFDNATYSIDEDAGTLSVNVTRSAGSTTAATVDYATADGSATAGSDYTAASGTLAFAPGETTASFTVPIIDDGSIEGNETFALALSNPTGGAALGATANATVTVVDVEEGGVIALSSATYTVPETGAGLLVTVTRSAGSSTAATVDCTTTNGTASAGSDYTTTTGTLHFAAGDTSATFNIPILDDLAVEGAETFTVTLSNPTGGATLGAIAAAVATINDDDVAVPGTLALATTSLAVQESVGTAVIQVTRSGGSDGAVSVAYATGDGSATAPADYTATSGVLTWPDGDSAPRSISVPIIDDADSEGAETFTLSLSDATGDAALGTSAATVTIAASDAVAAPSALPQVVPVFGEAGRVLLAGLLALAAWIGLRRRGGGALALLLALGCGAAVPDAQAAERTRAPARFSIATVDAVGAQVVLRDEDGSTRRIDAEALQLRNGARAGTAAATLAVGKIVLLRVDGKGEGKMRAWIFDSPADAAAMRERKLARHAR